MICAFLVYLPIMRGGVWNYFMAICCANSWALILDFAFLFHDYYVPFGVELALVFIVPSEGS